MWTVIKGKKFQQDHILTYKKNFGEHGLTAIAGWTTYYNSESHLNGSIRQRPGAIPSRIIKDSGT
jgi:hypothetical protein